MRQNRLYLAVLVALLAASGGCAQSPPVGIQPLYPKPSPVATSPSAQPPTSNLSSPTSQDAAWDNVVKAGKKEGSVTFYSVTYVGTDAEAVGKAFYQKYGIRVDFISGAGGSHGERLNVEKRMGQITGDVVQGSPARLFQMKGDGILETSRDLPVIQNKALWEVDPLLIDPDGHLPIFASNWSGPLINTRLLPPGEEPRSLKDFLQPKWKGKILSPDPRVFSSLSVSYVTFQRRGLIDWSYVEALGKQDLGWFTGSNDPARMIAKGDFALSTYGSASASAVVLLAGGPIKAISMDEGDITAPSSLALVKGAPHLNAAKVFLNWLFSKEGAIAESETNLKGYERLIKGAPSIPEALVPPKKKRITIGREEIEEGEKLYREQHISKLMGKVK